MSVTTYITEEELKGTLELTGTLFANMDIPRAIAAASRAIDATTGRRFYLDDDATSTRYYTPELCNLLPIDDLVTVTTLKTDAGGDGVYETTWTLNTDFTLTPLNAAASSRPFTTIEVHPTRSRYELPLGMPRGVELTGRFGWPTVPAEVVEATTILASKLLRRAREAPFGIVSAGIEVGVAMRIARSDPDVGLLLSGVSRNWITLA